MFQKDKLFHFVAGTIAALFGVGLWYVFAYAFKAPAIAAPYAGLLASVVAGVTKEAADFMDNRAALAAGTTPLHGVEFFDAVATSLPGLLICAVWLLK